LLQMEMTYHPLLCQTDGSLPGSCGSLCTILAPV
jgi:hypothetical protein